MQAILKGTKNIKLELAHNAESALLMTKRSRPDIILLDIDLSGMDGYEFFEEIHAKDTYKNIPIIAITAKAMAEEISKSLDYGFSAYITKPIDISQLFFVLNQKIQSIHE